MSKLIPLQLDDNTVIYVEAQEDAIAKQASLPAPDYDFYDENATRGIDNTSPASEDTSETPPDKRMANVESTLRHFTRSALKPFKEVAEANINKVTLEFGLKISAEGGVPFITKGGAETNLKVTVECTFDKPKEEKKEGDGKA